MRALAFTMEQRSRLIFGRLSMPTLSRAICVNSEWRREGLRVAAARQEEAALAIQRAARRALAKIVITRLRSVFFVHQM